MKLFGFFFCFHIFFPNHASRDGKKERKKERKKEKVKQNGKNKKEGEIYTVLSINEYTPFEK